MRRTLFALVASGLVASALAGCESVSSTSSQLRPRAAFDLNCPADGLEITPLNDSASGGYGVVGCGRRARYETVCGTGGSGDCTISLQSLDGEAAKSPKPAASGN